MIFLNKTFCTDRQVYFYIFTCLMPSDSCLTPLSCVQEPNTNSTFDLVPAALLMPVVMVSK